MSDPIILTISAPQLTRLFAIEAAAKGLVQAQDRSRLRGVGPKKSGIREALVSLRAALEIRPEGSTPEP